MGAGKPHWRDKRTGCTGAACPIGHTCRHRGVVAGLKVGRTTDSEITVFDSTGLAIQDVITAWHACRVTVEKELGTEIDALYLR